MIVSESSKQKSHISKDLQWKTCFSSQSSLVHSFSFFPFSFSPFISFAVFSEVRLEFVYELQEMRKMFVYLLQDLVNRKSFFWDFLCWQQHLSFLLKAQKMHWCHNFLPKVKLLCNIPVNCISVLALLSKNRISPG